MSSSQEKSVQTEEIPTHNQAASKTAKTSNVLDENNNNINPLVKVVFIQKILKYLQPEGIVVNIQISRATRETLITDLMSIPRWLQLRDVNTNWSETIDYYSSLPSNVVVKFCSYLKDFVEEKHPKSEQHAAVARDSLLWISKFVSDKESKTVKEWCRCVYEVIDDNRETNRIIFGTVSVRDVILDVSKYCTTTDSAYLLCRSIASLTTNDNNKILFGTASVRDDVLQVSEYCTTSGSADSFFRSIINLTFNNEANRVLLGTVAVRDAMLSVSKYCTTTGSADMFCRSIINIAFKNEVNKVLLGTVAVRDTILTVSMKCTTSDAADSFCRSIGSITANDNNKVLFGTVSVRDALLAISKYCASPDAGASFCNAILNNIYLNESNRVLFGTEAIRDAILSISSYIDEYYGVYCCCRAISSFQDTKPTLFCVEKTVASLVKLSKVEIEKQSPESIYWFLETVLTLLHSDQKLFDTPEIRNAVERFQEVVNDPEQVKKLEKNTIALDQMSNEEYLHKARQLCVEFQKVVSEKTEASSS